MDEKSQSKDANLRSASIDSSGSGNTPLLSKAINKRTVKERPIIIVDHNQEKE